MNSIKNVYPALKDEDVVYETMVMLHGLQSIQGTAWISIFESFFEKFNVKPIQGTGNSDDKSSHGKYSRVRKKLIGFMEEESGCFSIRMLSKESEKVGGEVSLYFSKDEASGFKLCFCVSDLIEPNSEIVENVVLKLLGNKVVSFFGGRWKYPSLFGSGAYFSGMAMIPEGYNYSDVHGHSQRLAQWRTNTYTYEDFCKRGAFKEVFPVTYVARAKAEKDFNGKPLSHYMKSNGTLTTVPQVENVFRWQIDPNKFETVQSELELSGLVFSANFELQG